MVDQIDSYLEFAASTGNSFAALSEPEPETKTSEGSSTTESRNGDCWRHHSCLDRHQLLLQTHDENVQGMAESAPPEYNAHPAAFLDNRPDATDKYCGTPVDSDDTTGDAPAHSCRAPEFHGRHTLLPSFGASGALQRLHEH